MKKLSIEEKAKAYDKAIERAKQHCADYVVETIFPELKESEDERIRKALIKYYSFDKDGGSHALDNITPKQIVTWLEKQGEQQGVSIQINPSEYINDMGGNGCYLKSADKTEPKFKVKYAGSEYNVLEVKDIAGVTYYGIEDEPNHIDYVKAENCEIISGYAIKENGSPYPTKPAVFSEQNSAWSEEDALRLEEVICMIEANGRWVRSDDAVKLNVDWLKSIKERYTWKPSDEQMQALSNAGNSFRPFEEGHKLLWSLYNDLKKLKG